MRKLRILAADAWYHVSTAVNNREPLFWVARERARFERVLSEAREIYVFELRGLRERCVQAVAPQPRIRRFSVMFGGYGGVIGRIRRRIQ